MELWQLEAREAIRDLVARYNANGDSGRYAQVVELFAPDGVMTTADGTKTGPEEILTIFTGARDRFARGGRPAPAPDTAPAASPPPPRVVRHFTATHQIDLVDRATATGRCYFQVLTSTGLDHWGRYVDEYRVVDGAWRFARRTVTIDGRSPDSILGPARGDRAG